MATFPLTSVFKAQWQLRTDDRVWSFGAHYRCSDGYDTATSAKDLLTALVANVAAPLQACLSVNTTVEGLYATHSLPETAMPAAAVANSLPGDDSGDAVPPNICAVLTFSNSTGELVRSGRAYIGGISKQRLLDGRWESDFVNTELMNLVGGIASEQIAGGSTFEMGVVRRFGGGVPITPIFVPVNAGRANQVAYSQRRRTTKQYGTRT